MILRKHNRPAYIYHFIISILLVSWVLYCAHKAAPSGGPEDKTPPQVLSNFPQTDSVGITILPYIEIEFSENIRQTTLPGNYWLLPELENNLEVDWKGSKKVRFMLKDSLEKNQTYVFTLGTGLTDMRNNKLESPLQIAFSTGTKLDRGAISGTVFADQFQRDVYIYAYLLNDGLPEDSLITRKPRYYSQIDKDGYYNLNYLSLSNYRLIALSDEDYNEIYSIETDQIGLPFIDVSLDSITYSYTDMNFYLIREDTTKPRIVDLDTLRNQEISIEFNEDITIDSGLVVDVSDSTSGEKIPILGTSFSEDKATHISFFLPKIESRKKLQVAISGISDLAGNQPQTEPMIRYFVNPASVDTTSPEYLGSRPNQLDSNVPFDEVVLLNFNVPLDTQSFIRNFQLMDSSENGVAGRFDFRDIKRPVFTPDSLLKSDMTYFIQLELDSLKDLWQRNFPDTVLSIKFSTWSMADLGEISGQVKAPHMDWTQAIVQARPVRGQMVYETLVRPGETYQMDYLPDGFYLLTTIIDRNENTQWDKGQTDPWRFAERFLFRPDTVKVRKRWTTQGIDFDFK